MNNQIQALALLPKLSEQQLLQVLQSGSAELPTYAVMAELQARKKRSADLSGAGKPPTTTVKQDMAGQGQAPMGQPAQPPMGPGMAAGGMPGDYGNAEEGYGVDMSQPDTPSPIMEWLRRMSSGGEGMGITGLEPGRPTIPDNRVGTEKGRATNTSSASSAPRIFLRPCTPQRQAKPATKPITRPPAMPTLPAAGVMATRPATAPEAAPSMEALPRISASPRHQASTAAAVAPRVLMKARAAKPLASRAEPALKPNQPTHSRDAPTMVNVRL